MTAQERYAQAQAGFEAASAEYERLNAAATDAPTDDASQQAREAYERATLAHSELTAAHAAWESETSAVQDTDALVEQVVASTTSPADGSSEAPADSENAGVFDSLPVQTPAVRTSATHNGPVVLQRGTSVRLIPQPPTGTSGVVLGRAPLQPTAQSRKQEITRNRKVAGNLPAWSPTPPGEIPTLGLRRRS